MAQGRGSLNRDLILREYQLGGIRNYDLAIKRLKLACVTLSDTGDEEFGGNPVFVSRFCPVPSHGLLLAAANEHGQILLWDTRRNMFMAHNGVTSCYGNAIFDLTWAPDELQIVTASGEKVISLWGCSPDFRVRELQRFACHDISVKTCAWNPDSSNEFASGDRQGVICIWDKRFSKPENVINGAHDRQVSGKVAKRPKKNYSSITGLTFYGAYYLISSGAGHSCIRMWDTRKCYSAYSSKPQPVAEFCNNKYENESGYAYLTIDCAGHKLFATGLQDRIYSFFLNTANCRPGPVYVGGTLRTFYVKNCVSPDGTYLISGSTSTYALIWNTQNCATEEVQPIRKIQSAGCEVNAVAWCKASQFPFKVAVFPECHSGEIYDLNPDGVSPDLWHTEDEEPDCLFDPTVSQVESELPYATKHKKSRFSMVIPNGLCKSKGFCPIHDKPVQSQHINSAGQSRKRIFREMLGIDSEGREVRIRRVLSLRRLIESENPDIEENSDTSVPSQTVNRCDVTSKDAASVANSSGSVPCKPDFERNVGHVTVPGIPVKISFSPTSNLPNHVVDGTSPSHVCRPRQKKSLDWLTEFRHGKIPDVENTAQNKLVIEPNTHKNEHFKKSHKKQRENILKFFQVLGKPADEQLKSSHGSKVVSNQFC